MTSLIEFIKILQFLIDDKALEIIKKSRETVNSSVGISGGQ
jgi:hypothetical protein